MRTFSFFFLLLFGYSNLYSQKNDKDYRVIQVLSLDSRAVGSAVDAFAESKESIVKQIGEEKYVEVMSKANMSGWPKKYGFVNSRDTLGTKLLLKRINELKLYEIARYDHIYQGKSWGNRSIIMAYYDSSSNNDPSYHLRTFYFNIQSSDIKVVEK